jgi:hypothetical protein
VSRAEKITALVLSLRRQAEAEVQAQLRVLAAQIERARRRLAAAQRQHEQAQSEQARLVAVAARQGSAAHPVAARALLGQSERLLAQRRVVDGHSREIDQRAAELQALGQREAELQAALRLALGRREAAELHEEQERREQRRTRAQRQRVIEEEARDRFLSAQRQGKPRSG